MSRAGTESAVTRIGPITVTEGDMFTITNFGADAYTMAAQFTWGSILVIK